MTCTIKVADKRSPRLVRSLEVGEEIFRIAVSYFMRVDMDMEDIDENFVDAHKITFDSTPEWAEYWEFVPCVNLQNGEVVFIHEDTQVDAEFSGHLELTPLT